MKTTTIILFATCIGFGCTNSSTTNTESNASDSAASAAVSPEPDTPPAPPVTDQWLGKWTGPEGTAIELTKIDSTASEGRYAIKLTTLDGVEQYEGTASGNQIEFMRRGKKESIRAGTGQETGMKWLLDKKNCLVIQTGEGFCRD